MEPVKKKINIFKLIDTYKPLILRGLKWWWLCLIPAVLMAGYSFYKNNKKPTEYSAKIIFMLDEDLGTQSAQGANPLLAAISGAQSGSNKALLIELSMTNKMIESTLLHKVKVKEKEMYLYEYYVDISGKKQDWENNKDLKNFKYSDTYQIGQNPTFDYILRSYTLNLKNILKTSTQESGVIIMSFSSSDELFTKLFLDNHLVVISEFYTLKKMEKSISLVKFAARKKDSLYALLAGKEFAAASVVDNAFGSVKKAMVVPEQLIKKDIGIINLQYNEMSSVLNQAKLDMERKKPFISIIDDIRLPLDAYKANPLPKAVISGIFVFILLFAGVVGVFFGMDTLKKQKSDFMNEMK